MKKLSTVLVLLALILAACAGTTDEADDSEGDGIAPMATCIEGVVDCEDTAVVPGEDAKCLPDAPDCNDTPGGAPIEEVPSGGMTVDGGLSVSDALGTDATGILAVRGFLVSDATGVRLCEVLAESFPPQCGGASFEVRDLRSIEELTTAEGDVRWSEAEVTIWGEFVDGAFVADETANG